MPKSNPKDNGVQIPFTDENFLQKWQEWLQYRKERRLATYTPTGLKRTFNKLVEDSQNDFRLAIQIIDQSLAMGWQGLFPIKAINNAAHIQSVTNNGKTGTSGSRIQAAKNF